MAEEEKRADVLFVIDASASMRPCFEKLRNSLKALIKPFREEGFDSLRLGLLAYNAGPGNGHWVYRHRFVAGDDPGLMNVLYGNDEDAKDTLFTRSGDAFVDVDGFCRILDGIECCADENTPLALDCAADFPFEPLGSTRRVVVMFTDEKFETGVLKEEPIGRNCATIERIMEKIAARHLRFYLFAPRCPSTDVISEFPRVNYTEVPAFEGATGRTDTWDQLDFEKVLEGIGRQVSGSVLQVVDEGPFDKAVYGQDQWGPEMWGRTESGGVIDITNVPEGVQLDMSEPLDWVNAKLIWNTPVDLDLHAFVRFTDGSSHHVYYADMHHSHMELDADRGIGGTVDTPAGNEENIRVRRLDGIERILFATKIFKAGGCFADYRGRVEVTTSNARQPTIQVDMVSRERKDWCVIAMLDNSNPQAPRMFPINRVMEDDPDVNSLEWRGAGR